VRYRTAEKISKGIYPTRGDLDDATKVLAQKVEKLIKSQSGNQERGSSSTKPNSSDVHVTTEETSKDIKGQMVLSWVLGLIGLAVLVLSLGSGEGGGARLGLGMIGAAIIWFFFLKARRWWEHG